MAPGPSTIQAGRAVAYDVDKGEARAIYGMGRHNHENTVAIPGYDELVLVSGDDTFSPPSAQLYMYLAEDQATVWDDEGSLWAFQGEGDYNDYGDILPGDSVSGSFIPVPRTRWVTRECSRTGRTRTTCSNSSGLKTWRTTATHPM